VKRGFKAEAKKRANDIRRALKVNNDQALNCLDLTGFLNISVYPVSKLVEYGFTTENIETICYADGIHQFSATTILVPDGYLILYNQAHSFARTNSSLAHEVSHIICEHEFSSINKLKNLSREFDRDKEDEANWMAGCLLLPEEGLIWALKKGMSIQKIADHFEVSKQMTQWRYNITGMKRRMRY
jgi:Zn-dependent peptidase ImmA (M78 family)